MQQPVIEGEMCEQAPPVKSYDDLFPALPESNLPNQNNNSLGQWNTKMRVGSSKITQVFRVPFEERKLEGNSKFGESESVQTCGNIMKDTGAHIEISNCRDGSLTFLVTGKQTEVLEAKRKILIHFQTLAVKQVSIPKEHHKWILGRKGERLKELEKQTSTKISVPSVNDSSDVISISGTKEGIEKAEHEIKITSDLQSKKAMERLDIPKIYHPFIVGPFGKTVNKIAEETGAKVNIPPMSVQKDEIIIAGEKEGVLAAKAKVEAIWKQMEKKCTSVSIEVPKAQHKYVIGPKGNTIAEILELTGVSVEMPTGESSTISITLRGPHDKLGIALSKVYEKANSVKSIEIEAPAWLHKYIIGRKGQTIKEITTNLSKVHVEFTDKDKIKIEGPPEEVEAAQEQIEAMVNDFVKKMTFKEMRVDPKLFKHIIGKNGANVNKLKEDYGVVINIDDSGCVRIEGNKDEVNKAKLELEEIIKKLENEKEKDVIIPQRHYKSIIGFKGETIREIRDKFNQVVINFPGASDKNDIVKVRGPKEDVDKCCRHLEKLVKELNESSYQISVPIFKHFHKFIIGKGGANIRKIREDTATKIDLPSEVDKSDAIIITGTKENVEKAREMIRKIQDELETIVNEEITISPKFYHSLIGAKGKLIHSIAEECGGVHIKFPSPESKSDKVTIRGPKEDVERAKIQLLDLASERQLASFTAEVRAKPQHHKFLIGKGGANIKKIRDLTGARIVFPSPNDEDQEVITIIGKKDSVEKAKLELEGYIKDIDNITEKEISVDPRHHKHFVARRGEVLHRITDECGGVLISFPRPGVESDKVVLKGSKDCIDAAEIRINEIISDLESQVTIDCVIPQVHHRSVMGAKGKKVQGITSEFDVIIKFPERGNTEDFEGKVNGDVHSEPIRQCDVIRITGKPENCAKAKQALEDLVPITIEVEVPFDLHRLIIGQRGRDVKELMDRFDVHISLSNQDVREDIIRITGAAQNVEDAKQQLLERVQELENDRKDRELKSFTLQVEVNPDHHPKIIGKRGAIITKIRLDHDVHIKFPKKGDPEEHIISISGYEANAHAAREDILRIVGDLESRYKEEVPIDLRVHSRLIGFKGRSIRKILDDYRVEIKFPRSDDPDPNIVVISGSEEDVLEAKEHLLNLEEEYLQEFEEQQQRRSDHQLNISQHFENQPSPVHQQPSPNQVRDNNGFVVQGAPWQQQAPNTASVTAFPSLGRNTVEEPVPQVTSLGSAWGSRR